MLPPFDRIGDSDWARKLTSFLASYDVPLATPCADKEIVDCESRLGFALPGSLREFLVAIGPQSFDYLTVFGPQEIRTPDEWFIQSMHQEATRGLNDFIWVADAGGSGNVFALELQKQTVHLVSHDPLGIHPTHESFDDLIREYCIDIFTGYYGWPDSEIEEMARELKADLFPKTV